VTQEMFGGICMFSFGLCFIIFRKQFASTAVKWNAKIGMRLDVQFMQFTYIVGGLIGIIAGVLLIIGGHK
jgi:hypothetical protein